jgi:hypothetical protein
MNSSASKVKACVLVYRPICLLPGIAEEAREIVSFHMIIFQHVMQACYLGVIYPDVRIVETLK